MAQPRFKILKVRVDSPVSVSFNAARLEGYAFRCRLDNLVERAENPEADCSHDRWIEATYYQFLFERRAS